MPPVLRLSEALIAVLIAATELTQRPVAGVRIILRHPIIGKALNPDIVLAAEQQVRAAAVTAEHLVIAHAVAIQGVLQAAAVPVIRAAPKARGEVPEHQAAPLLQKGAATTVTA